MAENKRKRATREKRSPVAEQIENRDRTTEPETEEIIGPDPESITEDRLIPSGSTLINCCCSDNWKGAFAMGTINTIPGKSQGGKTFNVLTMLTECAIDARFDEYELLYDDAEETVQGFNMPRLFRPLAPIVKNGKIIKPGRLLPPMYDSNNKPLYSNTIEDFKANVLLKCQSKKPFIYILDSLDTLTSSAEIEREYKEALKYAKLPEQVEKAKGSYKAEKAKGIGEALRMINGHLKKSDSALFILQQTRDKIPAPMFGENWDTSGGNAPYFYSFHRMYLAPIKDHKDEVRGIKNTIGGRTRVKIIKNKLTGKKRNCEIDIYESYGIDDLSGCIDFLCTTKEWNKTGAWLKHPFENDSKIQMSALIEYIEKNNLENDIRKLVHKVWMDIEDQMKLDRKRKY